MGLGRLTSGQSSRATRTRSERAQGCHCPGHSPEPVSARPATAGVPAEFPPLPSSPPTPSPAGSSVRWVVPGPSHTPGGSAPSCPGTSTRPRPLSTPLPSPPSGETNKQTSKQETYFLRAMQKRHLEHRPVTMVTLCFLNREERKL